MFTGKNFGIPQKEWDAAKAEARAAMIKRAAKRGMISYSDLVSQIKSVQLEAHDPRLNEMLAQVSTEEDSAGRGMLSVIVVHKVGDMEPGIGFYKLAKELGRNTSDLQRCWISELHSVHAIWG